MELLNLANSQKTNTILEEKTILAIFEEVTTRQRMEQISLKNVPQIINLCKIDFAKCL